MSDERLYTMRQRIEAIGRFMGHEFEFVDMPWDLALPAHVLWRRTRGSYFRDTGKIRRELGYRDVVDAADGLQQSLRWLLEHPSSIRAELEAQLGDPFDYAREDALVAQWRDTRGRMPPVDYPLPTRAHMYRHPSKPGEAWKRPDRGVLP
jgi:hypothetical protein